MKFHLFKRDDEWLWHLVDENDWIIATSIRGYKRHGDCLRSIAKVKSADDASILFVPYLSSDGPASELSLPSAELRLAAKG